MEKTRVPKGEKYWLIRIDINGVEVYCHEEGGWESDKRYFEDDNYFYSRKEAEAMAKKLRAVLKGADVIEMPSKEEYETFAVKLAREEAFVGETFSTRADWRMSSRMTVDWLKTKIVK